MSCQLAGLWRWHTNRPTWVYEWSVLAGAAGWTPCHTHPKVPYWRLLSSEHKLILTERSGVFSSEISQKPEQFSNAVPPPLKPVSHPWHPSGCLVTTVFNKALSSLVPLLPEGLISEQAGSITWLQAFWMTARDMGVTAHFPKHQCTRERNAPASEAFQSLFILGLYPHLKISLFPLLLHTHPRFLEFCMLLCYRRITEVLTAQAWGPGFDPPSTHITKEKKGRAQWPTLVTSVLGGWRRVNPQGLLASHSNLSKWQVPHIIHISYIYYI